MMHILVAGGTGFIGRNLIPALLNQQHKVTVLGRNMQKISEIFTNTVEVLEWDDLDSLSPDTVDAVINLAGENIGARRWTDSVKQAIINSRVIATSRLASWCASANNKPYLYNASAIGIYGLQPLSDQLPHQLTESSPIGDGSDFVSEVGIKWEHALEPAKHAHVPIILLRFAVVLQRNEGALKKIQPAFNFGMGGRIGRGTQPFCWVHVEDVVEIILFLLKHREITGIFNVCAPECIMQKEFASVLATCMKRPCLMITPAFIMKIMFGQMGEELLLQGQNVFPRRLLDNGYTFKYPTIKDALEHEF